MRQKFVYFDFDTKHTREILLSNQFFERYAAYLKKNQLPFMVEDLVAFYFIEEEWRVDRSYLNRNAGLDLQVTKEGVTKFVEVKSQTDSLKLNQLQFIFLNKGGIVIWVLPDDTDLSDLAYGGK